jgi:hypothetical protein
VGWGLNLVVFDNHHLYEIFCGAKGSYVFIESHGGFYSTRVFLAYRRKKSRVDRNHT